MKNLLLATLLALSSSLALSQDELTMNGLAAYEQLRQQYYIGALYLPYPANTADDVIFMPGNKRMDIRVTVRSWSPRRFAQQWNQLILINNPQDKQRQLANDIIAFTSIPKDDLQAGDQLTIDRIADRGTVVSLNGKRVMQGSEGLFELLVSCWVGARPPSTAFKTQMLSGNGGSGLADLQGLYEITAPTGQRRAQTAAWFGGHTQVASLSQRRPVEPVTPAAQPKASQSAQQAEEQDAKAKAKAEAEKKTRLAAQKAEEERLRKEAIAKAVRAAEAKAKQEAQRKAMITQYSTDMVRSSYRHVRYPKRALKLNQEGTVLLEVVLDRGGSVLSAKVLQSSSYPALDSAAIDAVEKTAPFPELPKEISGEAVEFTLPFTFQISG